MSLIGLQLAIPHTSGSPKFSSTQQCVYRVVGQAQFRSSEEAGQFLGSPTTHTEFLAIVPEEWSHVHPKMGEAAHVPHYFASLYSVHSEKAYK